jgi:hypothetical protein
MTGDLYTTPNHKVAKKGNNDERQSMRERRQVCPRNSRK